MENQSLDNFLKELKDQNDLLSKRLIPLKREKVVKFNSNNSLKNDSKTVKMEEKEKIKLKTNKGYGYFKKDKKLDLNVILVNKKKITFFI